MAIIWTRLHERLGIEARALTYADVHAAVDQQLTEDAQLEWKGERRTEEYAKAELAKDLAAMANSGGGLIVFGVGEQTFDDGTKRIEHTDVALDEQAEQAVRAVAWSRVRPLIAGVEIEFLENPDRSGYGALAVWIPASPSAPHFYEKERQPPIAPWRDGPHTENLREHEIERAYRDRFRRQEDAEPALARLVDHAATRLSFDGDYAGRWTVVATRPLSGPPLAVQLPDRTGVERILEEVNARERDFLSDVGRGAEDFRSRVGYSPGVGLRRWVFLYRAANDPDDELTRWGYCELHHDGSTVLAFPSSILPGPDGRPVVTYYEVERTIGSGLALARVWGDRLRIAGPVSVRTCVVNDPAVPRFWLFALADQRFSAKIPPWSRSVSQVDPVDSLLGARADIAADLEVAHDLALGVLNQFGVDVVRTLRPFA